MLKKGEAAAFEAVKSERAYQNALGNDRVETQEKPLSVGEELVILDTYLRRAQDAYTSNPGCEPALNEVRKVAAIAMRCMENHGAPLRKTT